MPSHPVPREPASESYFHVATLRRMWDLLNTQQPVDGPAVRTICLLLLLYYILSAALRFHPEQLAPLWGQGVMILALLFGVLFGPRFDWRGLRRYTLGMAFLLPGTTAMNVLLRGVTPPDILLIAVATFAPMVTLQTGIDVAIVVGVLGIGGSLALWIWAPLHAADVPTGIALGTALMAGAITALMRIFHHARVTESMVILEQALNARSEFVNTMSHELRSPLNVIIGYADILASEGGEQVSFMAQRIRANALELLQLVENTLSASRLGTGKVGVHCSQFALAELVGELRESTHALPRATDRGEPGVAVHWELPEGLPPVFTDRLKLKEIILNLVSNALKCTPQGSVTVRIRRDADWLEVEVEDTGIGIPPQSRERIFEMFERHEPAGEAHASGVGLGLYIVKSLVELLGGTVAVRSEVGRGSCFTVRLPYGRE
jgi:signal transduction histidine kinase